MAAPSNLVHVPKPSRKAYNPNRPLERNLLIKSQVEHFAEADRHLPPEYQTGIDVSTVKTEGQAAEYVKQVTAAIHKTGGRTQRVRTAT
jgi:hypothetical protein